MYINLWTAQDPTFTKFIISFWLLSLFRVLVHAQALKLGTEVSCTFMDYYQAVKSQWINRESGRMDILLVNIVDSAF
jgi:hypothetical protein